MMLDILGSGRDAARHRERSQKIRADAAEAKLTAIAKALPKRYPVLTGRQGLLYAEGCWTADDRIRAILAGETADAPTG